MIMNLGKKIICIKDIPSNIIEEAIFILKSNVVDNKDVKHNEKSKDIILNEAEEIVSEYTKRIHQEKEFEIRVDEDNKKILKKEIMYIVGLIIITFVCISIAF